MSETLSFWGAQAPPMFRPQMMIGAASPLWAYFTGAALAGVAYWWMSRWTPVALTAAAPLARTPAKVPALVVVRSGHDLVEEPVLEAEFVPAAPPPRPRRSKPVEVKPH